MSCPAIVSVVEAGPCHARDVRSLSARQREAARAAAALGYLRLEPARGRWPRRYVVTAGGSYALGTFDACADLSAERVRMWLEKEAARRAA